MLSGLLFIFFLIGILALSFYWIWVLIDILRSDFRDPNTKILWFLFVLFFHFVGSIVYSVFGRGTKVYVK